MESSALTFKQYALVNLSKCIVEFAGTAVIGVFYLLMGNSQAGVMLGYWIITLFGVSISGAHYNPAITVAVMLRNNSNFGSRRLKGLLYIASQILGGIVAAIASEILVESNAGDLVVQPMYSETSFPDQKGFAAIVSEATGAFVLVFLFMICTDKKTQYSNDKVVNCFIIAAAYCAARLMAGGYLVTVIMKES
jgi:glycerol uptake facilitator-like aquaporin